MKPLDAASILPEDGAAGTLVGRLWLPSVSGPSVVAMRAGGVFDVTSAFPTVSALAEQPDPAGALRGVAGTRIADLDDVAANTQPDGRDPGKPWLLAPLDLQVLKAAGVTFVVSMLERVIEERARGNPSSAAAMICPS
jgi:fumarylacetoacetate (FAA) hydrolase family protein